VIEYATTFGRLVVHGPSQTTPRVPGDEPGWVLIHTNVVPASDNQGRDGLLLIWTWERAVTAAKSAPRPPRKTREQLRRLMRLVEKH
jgi:hypothetical protein